MMLGPVVTPSRRCSRCCLPMPVVCPSVGEVPTGAPSCAIGRAASSPGNRSLGSVGVASRHRREASATFGRTDERTVVSCTESETPTLRTNGRSLIIPDRWTRQSYFLGCPPARDSSTTTNTGNSTCRRCMRTRLAAPQHVVVAAAAERFYCGHRRQTTNSFVRLLLLLQRHVACYVLRPRFAPSLFRV